MQINLKQPGQPVADFAVSGATVTVAGISIDCADRQRYVAVTIEIRSGLNGPVEGGDGAYLAQIEIPASINEAESINEDGESVASAAVMLDPNAVVVTLWPVA